MPTYGPWTQGPDEDRSADVQPLDMAVSANSPGDAFAGSGFASGYTVHPQVGHFRSLNFDSTIAYYSISVTVIAIDCDPSQLTPTVPSEVFDDPNVVDVQYEADQGTLLWAWYGLGADFYRTDPGIPFVSEFRHLPADLMPVVGDRPNRYIGPLWLTPDQYAAAPEIAPNDQNLPEYQLAFPTVTAVYPDSEYHQLQPRIDAADITDDLAVLAWIDSRSRTGAALPPPPANSGWQTVGRVGGFPTGHLHYRPPRYRVVYAQAPPQRRFPRDDGLGASTRRSYPRPTSRQYGVRRGGDNTYL